MWIKTNSKDGLVNAGRCDSWRVMAAAEAYELESGCTTTTYYHAPRTGFACVGFPRRGGRYFIHAATEAGAEAILDAIAHGIETGEKLLDLTE